MLVGFQVGRSCLVLRYKGKTIMLDCGVLPSFQGLESLPWLGELDPSEVDIVFITHFHLDHAAALPHFTERLAGQCPPFLLKKRRLETISSDELQASNNAVIQRYAPLRSFRAQASVGAYSPRTPQLRV